jgi:alkanesulfonate monooxygenase SsuD/methylene tetrahydromethanopterin reductase-like flavin-dependent oxidoreductase (luciferase family)
MLRLIGEKADGWLPSLAYLKGIEQIDESNARIDEAASAVGRDPRQVRRLVNIGGQFTAQPSDRLLVGPPSQWAEQLAMLSLEHGLSAFIVVGDDPNQLALFGQEVAPATRELVAAERGRRGTAMARPGAAS